MAATNVYGYLLTLKIGTKIIKGLETTGLKIKPNFEEILLKENAGVPTDDFIDYDTEMSFAGKTIERDSGESSTHEDFETIRVAAAGGSSVTFIYGRTVVGEKQVTGTAYITDYSEDAGSEKKHGGFSGSLKAVKGTVTFGTQA
jgi:hypothetical protein